jgi:hypothetical protein
MRKRWLPRLAMAALVFNVVTFGQTQDASALLVHFFLTQTTSPTVVSDAAGATRYDGGTVALGDGSIIGRYVRVLRTVNGVTDALNAALVNITLFAQGTLDNLTLQGSHSFTSGNETGGVTGASVRGFVGAIWDLHVTSDTTATLTVNVP